jgi:hypothetical protein
MEKRTVILNSERVNKQGYRTLNSALDWSYLMKDRSGQVRYNPETGDHTDGVVIGGISNIRLAEIAGLGECTIADLELSETSVGKDLDVLMRDGRITGLSIESVPGKKVHFVKGKDGVKTVTLAEMSTPYVVFSPANIDCRIIQLSETEAVVDYVPDLRFSDDDMSEKKMFWLDKESTARIALCEEQEAAEEAETLRLAEEAKAAEEAEALRLAEEAETLRLEEEEKERIKLAETAGLDKLDKPIIKTKTNMTRTFKEVVDDKKVYRDYCVESISLSENDGKVELSESSANFRRELATSMLHHPTINMLLNKAQFADQSQRGKDSIAGESAYDFTMRLAQEGQNVPTEIANLDNARIQYLSLFLQSLLSDDEFMRIFRLVNGTDITNSAGMIWTESDPTQYSMSLGTIAPLAWAAQRTMDKTRYLYRQVMAMRPVLFRKSNTDLLAYDKMSANLSEYNRIMKNNVHTYLLDRLVKIVLDVAQTDSSRLIKTTGDPVSTAGMFPNHLPLAAGTINSLTARDILLARSKVRMDNIRDAEVNIIIQEMFRFTSFGDSVIENLLVYNERPNNERIDTWVPNTGVFLYGRDKVSAMVPGSTAGSAPQWVESGLGYQNLTGTDGAVTPFTSAVGATALDSGLVAADGSALLGIGAINIWETQEPHNYGVTHSADISVGVAAARQGAKGLFVFNPTA